MKNNKLITFFVAFSMMISAFVGIIPASAVEVAPTVTKGIELVYDATNSTDTSKVIKAYYKGVNGLYAADVKIKANITTATAIDFTSALTGFNITPNVDLAAGTYTISGNTTAVDALSNAEHLFGTYTITVPADTADFKVEVVKVQFTNENDAVIKDADESWIIVPGAKTETPTQEPTEDPTQEPTQEPTVEPTEAPESPVVTTGIELVYDEANSTDTSKVIKAYYRGVNGLYAADVKIKANITTATAIDFTSALTGFNITPNVDLAAGTYTISGNTTAVDALSNAEHLFGTYTITVPSDTADFKVEVIKVQFTNENDAVIKDTDESWIIVPGAKTETPTQEPTEDPTQEPTQEPTAEPTATPVPTQPPVIVVRPTQAPTVAPTEAPTQEPTVEPTEAPESPAVTTGIELVYDEANSTDTSKVVKAYYRGVNGLYAADVKIKANITTATAIDFTSALTGFNITPNVDLAAGTYTISGNTTAVDALSNAEHLFGTYTITVPADTADFKVEVVKVQFTNENDAVIKDTDESWIIVPGAKTEEPTQAPTETPTEAPTPEPTPFPGITVNVNDLVKSTTPPEQAADGTTLTEVDLVGISVDVKTSDGKDGVYGEDFVAVYGDKELTKDEYSDLINGYADEMEDVIDGLQIVAKEGTTITVAPAFTAKEIGEGNIIVTPGQGGSTVAKEEEKPSTTPDSDYVTVSLNNVGNGTITATFTDEDGDEVTIEEGESEQVKVGTKVKFRASANSNYVFKKWTGDVSGTSTTVTVTVKDDMKVGATFNKKTSSSGSSGSSGGLSGSIANGSLTGSTGGVTTSAVGFNDLDSVPWAKTAINTLTALGVLNGRTDTTFDPNAPVTRAEFTKMVCATFGIGATPNDPNPLFTDVKQGDWYYGYIQAAAKYGVVNGVSDTEFAPNALITREQMATMLYRAVVAMNMESYLPAGAAKTFADAAQVSTYAVDSIAKLSAAGVINGVTDTAFDPQGYATRAQAACVIYQYYTAVGAM